MGQPGYVIEVVVDDRNRCGEAPIWDAQGQRLVWTDSCDVEAESGALRRKRVFVRVPSDQGIPDGLTVDREGFVWCALWYGAQIVRYDPDGTVERRIRFPVTQVSSLAFGGKDLTELFVTSASEPWRSYLAPPGFNFSWPDFGGELFRVRLQIQGKPEHLADLK